MTTEIKTGSVKLSDEKVLEIDNLIKAIAWNKRNTFPSIELDDMVSMLWCEVLKVINDPKYLNRNLLSTVIYRRIIDIIRKETNRNDYSVNDDIFSYANDIESSEADAESWRYSYVEGLSTKPVDVQKVAESRDLIPRLINLFPKQSKERQFIELWAVYSDAVTNIPIMDMGTEASKHSQIARKLGYAGASSSSYAGIRWNVRAKVEEYLKSCGIYTKYKAK